MHPKIFGAKIFDAIVYGFPIGGSEIRMSFEEGKIILDPLLKEMLKYKEVARGTAFKDLWDVHLYGCTDRVQGSREYNDLKLRKQRAESLKSYLIQLFPKTSKQPKIFNKPLQKSLLPYVSKGRGWLERAQNRSVGILFVRPSLPPGCYDDGILPTINETTSAVKSALSKSIAKVRLGNEGWKFWNGFLVLIANKGNDEYITWEKIQKAIDRWSAQYRITYSKIEKLPPKERDNQGRLNGMKPFPNVRSEQIKWMSLLTNRILMREKPEVFTMTSISMLSRVREVVRNKCGDPDLILISLKALLDEFLLGRKAVHQYRNFRCAIAYAIGGLSALQNFIEVGVREWMENKEKQGNTIYSLFITTWPSKKFPFFY